MLRTLGAKANRKNTVFYLRPRSRSFKLSAELAALLLDGPANVFMHIRLDRRYEYCNGTPDVQRTPSLNALILNVV